MLSTTKAPPWPGRQRPYWSSAAWLWFLREPAQVPLSQEQLNALAAQASKSGAKQGRESEPYKDEAVKNTIRKHALSLQKPWLTYLAGKPARTDGAVTLDWTIAPDGKATQVAVVHSGFESRRLQRGDARCAGHHRLPAAARRPAL